MGPRGRMAAAAAAVTMLSAAGAQAQTLLTAASAPRLCRDGRVDPERLAEDLVAAAATPFALLDRANPTGDEDGAVRLRAQAGGLSEPRYVLAGLGVGAAPRPFGPAIDPASDAEAKAAAARLAALVASELDLPLLDPLRAGEEARGDFSARRAPGVAGPIYAYQLFQADPKAYIACPAPATTLAAQGETPKPPLPANGETPAKTEDRTWRPAELRLRGAVADLRNFSDLKDAKAASVSYDLDETKDKATFAFNIVVGAYFETEDASLGLAPFLLLENKDTRDDKDEIKTVSPGLFGVWKPNRGQIGPLGLDYVGLEAAWVEDMANDAKLARARLYVAPYVALGKQTLFGTAFRFGDRFAWRPDLLGVIDAADIQEAGDNKTVQGIRSYFAAGGDFSNVFYLNDAGVFSDFSLRLGWRQLWFHGAIKQDVLYRRYGALEYKPAASQWLGIALTYDEGDNDDTFQPVDTVALKLTLRR